MLEKILIMLVDDEPHMIRDLKLLLEAVGNYDVCAFTSGKKALEYLSDSSKNHPALIISDIAMPEMNGYEFGKEIRDKYHIHDIPLLYLTAKTAVKDRIDARAITPHYFPKDGDRRELLSVINSILEEHLVQVGLNPTTRLPGNNIIEKSINKIVTTEKNYAILYIDFDNFKAYNDSYGTHAGDRAIQEGAIAIDRAFRQLKINYFLGHIGGDDFLAAVWGENNPEHICKMIFSEIDNLRGILYSSRDIKRGYFESKNRQGEIAKFGLLSVSIAILTNHSGNFSNWSEMSTKLSEIKKLAKNKPGNSFTLGVRP